jgi:hypothetical protein
MHARPGDPRSRCRPLARHPARRKAPRGNCRQGRLTGR